MRIIPFAGDPSDFPPDHTFEEFAASGAAARVLVIASDGVAMLAWQLSPMAAAGMALLDPNRLVIVGPVPPSPATEATAAALALIAQDKEIRRSQDLTRVRVEVYRLRRLPAEQRTPTEEFLLAMARLTLGEE